MKKILKIALTAVTLTLFSCEDALDKFPLDKLSPETNFSSATELQLFSNQFYTMFPGGSSIYGESADNIVTSEIPLAVRGGRVVPTTGGGWSWENLRSVNTLLYYSNNCKDMEVRNRYDALARFFRAYFYFDKVKDFGDVPWIDHPLGSAEETLYGVRDSRELVMTNILADIDFAITYLPQTKDAYRVTKWTALALKSRICLFEGTFRKYHNITLPGNGSEYYLGLAAEAAETFMLNSGYKLYSTGTAPYRDLFASLTPFTDEIILCRDYNIGLGQSHSANNYTISTSMGRPGLTKKIVNSYLMSDGTRFTDKVGYGTMLFKDECLNRDPRLAQTIRTPGYTRIGATVKLAPGFTSTLTGYQPIKYVMASTYDEYNKSYNDLPLFRTAEVYLNFAEAKAELGTLTQTDIDNSIKKIRDRARMPNLNMAAANANPDPYLMARETGYPNVTGSNKGVILEIRRERSIELIMEGFRYDDMMRWREGKAFEQPFFGLYIPGPGTYDLDGNGTNDVCFYEGTKPAAFVSLFLKIGQDVFLSEGNKGFIDPHGSNARIWLEDRDYLNPVPIQDRTLTKGKLTQNPGWVDGLDF